MRGPARWWVVGSLGACLALVVSPAAFGHACDRTDNDRAQASRVISSMTAEDRRDGSLHRRRPSPSDRAALGLSGAERQGDHARARYQNAARGAHCARGRGEESRSQRAHRPSESACRAISGLRGLGASREVADAARANAVEGETARIQGEIGAAVNISRFSTVTSRYCNAERQKSTVCGADAARHGIDLKASTLFDQRTFTDDQALHDAIEVARNLAAPVVNDPLAYASAGTEEEMRRVLRGRSADGRVALAADYFAHARALRVPGAGLGAWVAAVAPGAAVAPARGISRYELLEVLASGRFEDPNWFIGLQAMSGENLLRELIMLKATALTLAWQQYRLDERRGALAAAALAMEVEAMRERVPGLSNPATGAN